MIGHDNEGGRWHDAAMHDDTGRGPQHQSKPPPADPGRPDIIPDILPAAGFDWGRVSWTNARDAPAPFCSYCSAPNGEGEIAMQLSTRTGLQARFCEDCQWRWWGIERLA